ncbi:hypothetical protein PG993_000309 [Apiospora rasikravindrae]|uniref:Uncharacterized protein n=1 Tax=Apiospora rasikravindrae TaxID=990691 RepID=A0ABR1U879_9PEZI
MASRIVLITGKSLQYSANSGVGYATTQVLAAAPEKFHVIMACRSLAKANAAKAEIEAGGITGSISTVQLDVTDDASIEAAAASVEQQLGRLDVLVNNAAMGVSDLDARTRFLKTMETNTFGPWQVAKAFRPLLLKSSTGSGAYSIYAALNMYMVLDWRQSKQNQTNVKVFGMCPGFVVSNLRGPSEAARNPGGAALDPRVSGELVLSIVQGQRDADEGRVVRFEGTWPW